MKSMDCRTALVMGAGLAATTATAAVAAEAARYPAGAGEPFPNSKGVRMIKLSEVMSMIPGISKIQLLDLAYDPGVSEVSTMTANMVCHCVDGELLISNNGREFTAKTNEVWTCNVGGTEGAKNLSSGQSVMRVAVLVA